VDGAWNVDFGRPEEVRSRERHGRNGTGQRERGHKPISRDTDIGAPW
jgi:hypothetical protein